MQLDWKVFGKIQFQSKPRDKIEVFMLCAGKNRTAASWIVELKRLQLYGRLIPIIKPNACF